MDLVADASVVVKWFVEEDRSDLALLLRDDFVAGDVDLHAPVLLPFEVLNALRFTPEYPSDRCERVQIALDGYGFHLHPLQGELGRRAIASAYAEDLSVYDAAYLELARLMEVQLVTDDSALIRAGGEAALSLSDYASPFDA